MKAQQRQARAVARLAAVQALYQMEASGIGAEAVIREFIDHRFDAYLEGVRLAEADEGFFGDIVRGAVSDQTDIDQSVARRLAAGWRLDRIDATARAILRAAAYEILRTDAPIEVVVDEYVEVAKSFFDGPEPGFIHATLDAIARDERT